MTITPYLFEAFLRCPTKCWLRSANEPSAGNAYAQWSKARNECYRAEGVARLAADRPASECVAAPAVETIKSAAWLLGVDVAARAAGVETRIAAVERVPSAGRGKTSSRLGIWPMRLAGSQA